MAANSHLALFIKNFAAYNQTRYADSPDDLAKFQGLTDADITLSNLTRPTANTRSATVVSGTKHFSGDNQTWTAAPADTDLGLYTIANGATPLASVSELANQTTAGVYSYDDAGTTRVGVVIANGVAEGDKAAAVEAAVRAALVYDIPTVTVDTGAFTVLMDGDHFYGTLTWAEGAVPNTVIPATDYGTFTS